MAASTIKKTDKAERKFVLKTFRDDLYEKSVEEILDDAFLSLIDRELKREDLFAFAIRHDGVTLVFKDGRKFRI